MIEQIKNNIIQVIVGAIVITGMASTYTMKEQITRNESLSKNNYELIKIVADNVNKVSEKTNDNISRTNELLSKFVDELSTIKMKLNTIEVNLTKAKITKADLNKLEWQKIIDLLNVAIEKEVGYAEKEIIKHIDSITLNDLEDFKTKVYAEIMKHKQHFTKQLMEVGTGTLDISQIQRINDEVSTTYVFPMANKIFNIMIDSNITKNIKIRLIKDKCSLIKSIYIDKCKDKIIEYMNFN